MNITTRRHPRTLHEAFGPYTSSYIDVPKKSLFRTLLAFFFPRSTIRSTR